MNKLSVLLFGFVSAVFVFACVGYGVHLASQKAAYELATRDLAADWLHKAVAAKMQNPRGVIIPPDGGHLPVKDKNGVDLKLYSYRSGRMETLAVRAAGSDGQYDTADDVVVERVIIRPNR